MMLEAVITQFEGKHWHVPRFEYIYTTPPKRFDTYSVERGSKVLHRCSVIYADPKSKKNSAIMRFHSFSTKRIAQFYAEIFRDVLELRGRRECNEKHKTIMALDANQLSLLLDCLREDKLALLQSNSCAAAIPAFCMFNNNGINIDRNSSCGEGEWFKLWTEKYYTGYPCVVCFVAPKTGNECMGSQFHYDQNGKSFILDALNCETYKGRKIFGNMVIEDIVLFHMMRYNTEEPDICQALVGCALARWELIGHRTNLSNTESKYFDMSYEGNIKYLAYNAHLSVTALNTWQPVLSQSTANYFNNAAYHSDDVYAQRYADILMQIVIIVDMNEEHSRKASKWFVPAAESATSEMCTTSDKVIVVVRTKKGTGTVGPKYWGTRFTCCCGLPDK